MIDKKVFDFLSELKMNNNRDWFQANKDRYLEAKASFDESINQAIPLIRDIDPTIDMITARDCTFRIYRDVRFSKDKNPYKANMGAYIAKGGRKSMKPGYYIHIEPEQSFLAGGLYMPPADELKKVREEIYYNVDEFKKIINDKQFTKYFGDFHGTDKLKNAPKGFDKDWPDIDILRNKSYAVVNYVDNDQLISADGNKYMIQAFSQLLKLNRFLWKAIG